MSAVQIAGESFHVLLEGREDAPVLMISNSLGTNLHMWDAQMPEFRKHFRVLRYDSRGHGGSTVSAGPYSIAQLGRDALGIMDALGLSMVHWLGLSMGGMVGQWLLCHAPHRIDRAILANTAAHMPPPDIWNGRIRTVLNKGMAAITPIIIERWFTRSFQDRAPEAVAKIAHMLDTMPPLGYAGCCAAIRDMDQREALRAIQRPVMVIVGRHDPSIPAAAGAFFASAIPGTRLITLEAAHLSNIEAEAEFTRTASAFFGAPT